MEGAHLYASLEHPFSVMNRILQLIRFGPMPKRHALFDEKVGEQQLV